jgi:hypothetical protein
MFSWFLRSAGPLIDRAGSHETSKDLDLGALKRHVRAVGLPENLRGLAWLVLLNVLPWPPSTSALDADHPEREYDSIWEDGIRQKTREYQRFCDDFCTPATSSGSLGPEDDHPLSDHSNSTWKQYFNDKEVKEQIDRDVSRTQIELSFFRGTFQQTGESHERKIGRGLFVYQKLAGLTYVQGMNELFAVLYYVMSTLPPGANVDLDPEVASFYCFNELLGEFRENYCPQLDRSELGISGMMDRLSGVIGRAAPLLNSRLMGTLTSGLSGRQAAWLAFPAPRLSSTSPFQHLAFSLPPTRGPCVFSQICRSLRTCTRSGGQPPCSPRTLCFLTSSLFGIGCWRQTICTAKASLWFVSWRPWCS